MEMPPLPPLSTISFVVGRFHKSHTEVTFQVTSTPGYGQCQYPEHSVPFCGLNPCDFTCTDGFLPSPIINPKDCVCQAPFSVCNGICGIFLSCSSQKAKRDINWRDATCPHGWSACGVFGASRLDYECVDVNNDLWSCECYPPLPRSYLFICRFYYRRRMWHPLTPY